MTSPTARAGRPVRPAAAAQAAGPRRRIPLRPTCAQPHSCPRPLRMTVLGQVPVLEGLTEADLDSIDRRAVSLSWAAGDPVFVPDAAADHVYVLAAGRVKLTQPQAGGQDVVVDILVPGDLFGGLGIVGGPAYTESAVALTTTCALRVSTAVFRDILAEHPAVALRVLDDLARQLAAARARVGSESTATVEQRVAAVLLRLADRLGQDRAGDGGTLIQVPLSRADLAGMAGSTPESVSRVMSRLKRDGVIDSGRRWTAVLDRERLATLA